MTASKLQDMLDQWVETGRNCGMKVNAGKSKIMRILGREEAL